MLSKFTIAVIIKVINEILYEKVRKCQKKVILVGHSINSYFKEKIFSHIFAAINIVMFYI